MKSLGLSPASDSGESSTLQERPYFIVLDLSLGSKGMRYQGGILYKCVFSPGVERLPREEPPVTGKKANEEKKGGFQLQRSVSEAELLEGESGWHLAEGGAYEELIAEDRGVLHNGGGIYAAGLYIGVEKLVALVSSFDIQVKPMPAPDAILKC